MNIFKNIRDMGWSVIRLSKKGFRGAIKVYKPQNSAIVPIFFYLHEAFVIEDKDGLFGVQDLDYSLIKSDIDLEATGCIRGLILLAAESEGKVTFNLDDLQRFGINTSVDKQDIANRLKKLAKLDVYEDVPSMFE